MNASLRLQRAVKVKQLVRSHAKACGAPKNVTHQAEKLAAYEVCHGCSVWRAYSQARSWIESQADATGWWGKPA